MEYIEWDADKIRRYAKMSDAEINHHIKREKEELVRQKIKKDLVKVNNLIILNHDHKQNILKCKKILDKYLDHKFYIVYDLNCKNRKITKNKNVEENPNQGFFPFFGFNYDDSNIDSEEDKLLKEVNKRKQKRKKKDYDSDSDDRCYKKNNNVYKIISNEEINKICRTPEHLLLHNWNEDRNGTSWRVKIHNNFRVLMSKCKNLYMINPILLKAYMHFKRNNIVK